MSIKLAVTIDHIYTHGLHNAPSVPVKCLLFSVTVLYNLTLANLFYK